MSYLLSFLFALVVLPMLLAMAYFLYLAECFLKDEKPLYFSQFLARMVGK